MSPSIRYLRSHPVKDLSLRGIIMRRLTSKTTGGLGYWSAIAALKYLPATEFISILNELAKMKIQLSPRWVLS
jgi:hypothetical protein